MKKEEYLCDVVGCGKPAEHKSVKIQVIFHTDQTEGRSTAPYLSDEKMDLCDSCKKKILEGNYVHASGAQGNNEYKFTKNEKQ